MASHRFDMKMQHWVPQWDSSLFIIHGIPTWYSITGRIND